MDGTLANVNHDIHLLTNLNEITDKVHGPPRLAVQRPEQPPPPHPEPHLPRSLHWLAPARPASGAAESAHTAVHQTTKPVIGSLSTS